MESNILPIRSHRVSVLEITLVGVFTGSLIVGYLFSQIPLLFDLPLLFSLFIVMTGIPSYYFLYRWIGIKYTIITIISLTSLVFLIESLGIVTGVPYGYFFYTERLGFKILGLVPWSVPFAFVPLLLGTLVISSRLFKTSWMIVSFSAILLVLFDLVLEPALVLLVVWVWISAGVYYGVPISNYMGWFITGIITSIILFGLLRRRGKMNPQMPPLVSISFFLCLGFWASFSLWNMLIIPFFVSLILVGLTVPFLLLSAQTRENRIKCNVDG